jgi:hypothetical protein
LLISVDTPLKAFCTFCTKPSALEKVSSRQKPYRLKRLEKRILDLEKVLTIKDDDASENKKNLTVVSLRNVNMDIRKMLPMLLVKELYDKKNKLLIVILPKHSSVFVKTKSKSEFA